MSYQTDKPRENHARIVRALELCSDIYRDIILSQIPPEDLKSRSEGRTRFYDGLPRDEKEKIKNASKRKTLEDLDLSIMYKILRNVCIIPAPKSGWGSLTLPSPDVELADDIERIRFIRNEASGHSPKSQIEDATFSIIWNELSLVVERMDLRNSRHYSESLEEIGHCSMNARVETIRSITKDTQCLFNNTFHCRIDRIAGEVQRRLWENNCIILTGIGGCGKSSIAKQAVKELSRKISTKDIFFVNNVEEFSSVVGLGDLQVVLIDDPFGKSNLKKTEFDSWDRYFSKMEALVKSKKCFLLLTCRKSIFESVKGFTDKCYIFDKKNIMDLSTEWNFTISEKKHFLYENVRYFEVEVHDSSATLLYVRKRRIKSSLIDSISKTVPRMGFPQACHLFFSNWDFFKQGLDFFVKADKSLIEEINSIRARSPEDYAILVYVLLQSNHEIDIKGKYEMELIEKICKLLEIMKLSPLKLHDKVTFTLSSLYLKKKGSASQIYTFQHESILESVLESFCQFFAKEFLEMAPFDIIRHFIRPSFHQTQPGEICYLLSPDLDSNLVCWYGENIIEEKAPIDDLWIICDFWEVHLQSLLNSLNESGIGYIYQKTKNIRKRYRVCNDAIRKHILSEKACTLIRVVLTMFPDVIFEYLSFNTLFYNCIQNKSLFGTILDCTFSSVMLQYKDLSNKNCMTGLVRLLLSMFHNNFKEVTSDVMKGMDNLITEIKRLSYRKKEMLFWSVMTKEINENCYQIDDYQIDMCEILIEKACKFLSNGELMRLGEMELWDCLDPERKKNRTAVGKRILNFIRSIPGTTLQEWIMTEKLTSAVFVYILEHVLNSATETMIKNSNCVSCINFLNVDHFANLSQLCKRFPNFITCRTIESAINLGAVELLRLLFFYECITDIHLQAISEWQRNDGEGNSLKELLKTDDCMVIFGIIQRLPQVVTQELIREAIKIGAINSLRVFLFYKTEIDSHQTVIQRILNTKIFPNFDGHVDVLKKLFDIDNFDLYKMINATKSKNGDVVRLAIRKTCQKDALICWNTFLCKDNPEIMSLLVKELPEIITYKTVQEAIKTGAMNSLKVILTSEKHPSMAMEVIREAVVKGTQTDIKWTSSVQNENEIISLLKSKFLQIISYRTDKNFHKTEWAHDLYVLEKIAYTIEKTKRGIKIMQALLKTLHNHTPINWKKFFEKDDAEILKLLIGEIPKIITYTTVQAAIESNAVNSLKTILTTEKVTNLKIHTEMAELNELANWWKIFNYICPSDWERFLVKDDVELMNLIVREIPRVITSGTIIAAIQIGAISSLKAIFNTKIVIDAISEKWEEECADKLLFANDYDEIISPILMELLHYLGLTLKKRQKVIENRVVNSFDVHVNLACTTEFVNNEENMFEILKVMNYIVEKSTFKFIYWNSLLEKDDVEVMSLVILKLPQIITTGTVKAAIETKAVNSLRVILTAEKETENDTKIRNVIRKTLEMDTLLLQIRLLLKDEDKMMGLINKFLEI